jgi:hypothetical protein
MTEGLRTTPFGSNIVYKNQDNKCLKVDLMNVTIREANVIFGTFRAQIINVTTVDYT